MTTATKSSRTLSIDGMSGEDCCKKVTGALKGVSNVETHTVKVGSAKIEADEAGCKAACQAIGGAGFKANEQKHEQKSGQKQDQVNGKSFGGQAGSTPGAKADQVEPKAEQKTQAAGAGNKPASGTR